jgi:hypothetical protein
MTLKSAPVRATAFMKLTRATRTKPAWLVSRRTCAANGGGAAASAALMPVARVSGI